MTKVARDAVRLIICYFLSFAVEALVDGRSIPVLLLVCRIHEGLEHVLHVFYSDGVRILRILWRWDVGIAVFVLKWWELSEGVFL